MPHRILIKGEFVLSMDPQVGDLPVGDVLIEDGQIAAIGPTTDADADCDSGITTVLDWSHRNNGPDCDKPKIGALRKLRETEFSSDDQLLGLAMAARGSGTTTDARGNGSR